MGLLGFDRLYEKVYHARKLPRHGAKTNKRH